MGEIEIRLLVFRNSCCKKSKTRNVLLENSYGLAATVFMPTFDWKFFFKNMVPSECGEFTDVIYECPSKTFQLNHKELYININYKQLNK